VQHEFSENLPAEKVFVLRAARRGPRAEQSAPHEIIARHRASAPTNMPARGEKARARFAAPI
jgi:hypothetical protein